MAKTNKRSSRDRRRRSESVGPRTSRNHFTILAQVVIASIVLATPLIVLPRHQDAFALPKLLVAETLGVLSLVLLAAGWLAGEWSVPRGRVRAVLVPLLPLALWILFGVLASEHRELARSAGIDFAIGLACLWGWTLALTGPQLRRLLFLMIWPSIGVAVLALLQSHELYQPFSFSAGGETARMQVTSLAGAAGDLAAYLALSALLWLSGLLGPSSGERQRWRKAGWAAGLLLCVYGVALTQTFTAIAALLVGATILGVRSLPSRRLRWIGGAALLGMLAIVVLATPLRIRVEKKIQRIDRGGLNEVLSGRLDAWRVAGRILEDHPNGSGLGTYRAEYVPTKLQLMDEGKTFYRGHIHPTFSQAHNEILQVGAELGWIGLGCLAFALFALTRGDLRREPAPEDSRLLWSLAAAYVVLSLAHFPWHLALTAYPGILVAALALGPRESA